MKNGAPKYSAWCDELRVELAEPFPASVVQVKELKSKKTGKVAKVSFVSWHLYAQKLNRLVGVDGWQTGLPAMTEAGGRLVTAVPVTILGVTKVNVGDEDEAKVDFGSASTNGWAQAFKRSCALFGMGLDQYDKKNLADRLDVGGNGKRPESDPLEGLAYLLRELYDVRAQLSEDEAEACRAAHAYMEGRKRSAAETSKHTDAIVTIAGVHGIELEPEHT